jgi:hypothetical protein
MGIGLCSMRQTAGLCCSSEELSTAVHVGLM